MLRRRLPPWVEAGLGLRVRYVHRAGGWLATHLPEGRFHPPRPPELRLIEGRAAATQALGPQPLWRGYANQLRWVRSPDEVRSSVTLGCFFFWLAATRRPGIVAEFGTAFGVSGMYWLAGIKAAGSGRLLTFDPNRDWAALARANLACVHPAFDSTIGLFEEEIGRRLAPGQGVDIAFVDGIHASTFVDAQFGVIRQHAAPGALVLFDDINFSPDMEACWAAIARRPDLRASATVGARLGIVELA